METYIIISDPDGDGKASIRRASDKKVSRCKLTWLVNVSGGVYTAKSKTKAIRLDGLEWKTEG